MLSDYRILGLEEGADRARVKAAFRKRAKELHPDLSTEKDALARHDLFIEICKAYRRLLERAGDAADLVRPAQPRSPSSGSLPKVHGDPAYVFYRQGMRQFMAIHPSKWNLDGLHALDAPIAGHEEEVEKNRLIVKELVRLFPKAYYYFSIVVHEYPDSPWADDSREKMKTIEERIAMYRRIVASFSDWGDYRAKGSREHQDVLKKMEEGARAVRKEPPEGW